jgi:beta-glucosidase-like glycosyl hydrolase
LPVDERALAALAVDDLVPFGALIHRGLEAIMPAHVVYPRSTTSPRLLAQVAAGNPARTLGFDGLIFSDDLGMAGAQGVGDLVARAEASVAAGCDMVLACNDFEGADALLARWSPPANRDSRGGPRKWRRVSRTSRAHVAQGAMSAQQRRFGRSNNTLPRAGSTPACRGVAKKFVSCPTDICLAA